MLFAPTALSQFLWQLEGPSAPCLPWWASHPLAACRICPSMRWTCPHALLPMQSAGSETPVMSCAATCMLVLICPNAQQEKQLFACRLLIAHRRPLTIGSISFRLFGLPRPCSGRRPASCTLAGMLADPTPPLAPARLASCDALFRFTRSRFCAFSSVKGSPPTWTAHARLDSIWPV